MHYEFDFSESGAAFDNYFRGLKSVDYKMKSLTFDDKSEIANAARRHYPNCVFQLCTRHFKEKISRESGVAMILIRIKSLEKKIDHLFDGEESEYISGSRMFDIKRICKFANDIAELEFKYEILIDFQKIISSILYTENLEIAEHRIYSLRNYFWKRRWKMRDQFPEEQISKVKKLLSNFFENKKHLINYLKYPHLNIPNTTNLIEGFNSQFELRLGSIKGFGMDETANNYVNAWLLKRRFTKYTDCRDKFKHLNGKTPLECAGADISDIQFWVDFCQNLPK